MTTQLNQFTDMATTYKQTTTEWCNRLEPLMTTVFQRLQAIEGSLTEIATRTCGTVKVQPPLTADGTGKC
jgi:hypothetical protein